ncbi:MAG TPA: MerR family transcriptional regulator [Solirubrobacteraceae bacterium]
MSTASANSHNGTPPDGISIDEAAERVGVAVTTLRRWAREGLFPRYDGSWSPPVVSHARIVARLRDRGHSLKDIRQATDEGRLAYGYVEELFDSGEGHAPERDARVIKTIGDEVMIVGSDPAALTEWAVSFQRLQAGGTMPRIAVHYGNALYRDGDYYGRDVNIASRVGARAAGAEVLVTRPVVEHARRRRVRADRRRAAEGIQ